MFNRAIFRASLLAAVLGSMAPQVQAAPRDTPDWKTCADFLTNDDSEPACTRLIEKSGIEPPDLAQAHYYRGSGRYFRDENATAVTDLTTTIRLVPSHAGARMMRVAAYWDNGQWFAASVDVVVIVWRSLTGTLTDHEEDEA